MPSSSYAHEPNVGTLRSIAECVQTIRHSLITPWKSSFAQAHSSLQNRGRQDGEESESIPDSHDRPFKGKATSPTARMGLCPRNAAGTPCPKPWDDAAVDTASSRQRTRGAAPSASAYVREDSHMNTGTVYSTAKDPRCRQSWSMITSGSSHAADRELNGTDAVPQKADACAATRRGFLQEHPSLSRSHHKDPSGVPDEPPGRVLHIKNCVDFDPERSWRLGLTSSRSASVPWSHLLRTAATRLAESAKNDVFGGFSQQAETLSHEDRPGDQRVRRDPVSSPDAHDVVTPARRSCSGSGPAPSPPFPCHCVDSIPWVGSNVPSSASLSSAPPPLDGPLPHRGESMKLDENFFSVIPRLARAADASSQRSQPCPRSPSHDSLENVVTESRGRAILKAAWTPRIWDAAQRRQLLFPIPTLDDYEGESTRAALPNSNNVVPQAMRPKSARLERTKTAHTEAGTQHIKTGGAFHDRSSVQSTSLTEPCDLCRDETVATSHQRSHLFEKSSSVLVLPLPSLLERVTEEGRLVSQQDASDRVVWSRGSRSRRAVSICSSSHVMSRESVGSTVSVHGQIGEDYADPIPQLAYALRSPSQDADISERLSPPSEERTPCSSLALSTLTSDGGSGAADVPAMSNFFTEARALNMASGVVAAAAAVLVSPRMKEDEKDAGKGGRCAKDSCENTEDRRRARLVQYDDATGNRSPAVRPRSGVSSRNYSHPGDECIGDGPAAAVSHMAAFSGVNKARANYEEPSMSSTILNPLLSASVGGAFSMPLRRPRLSQAPLHWRPKPLRSFPDPADGPLANGAGEEVQRYSSAAAHDGDAKERHQPVSMLHASSFSAVTSTAASNLPHSNGISRTKETLADERTRNTPRLQGDPVRQLPQDSACPCIFEGSAPVEVHSQPGCSSTGVRGVKRGGRNAVCSALPGIENALIAGVEVITADGARRSVTADSLGRPHDNSEHGGSSTAFTAAQLDERYFSTALLAMDERTQNTVPNGRQASPSGCKHLLPSPQFMESPTQPDSEPRDAQDGQAGGYASMSTEPESLLKGPDNLPDWLGQGGASQEIRLRETIPDEAGLVDADGDDDVGYCNYGYEEDFIAF